MATPVAVMAVLLLSLLIAAAVSPVAPLGRGATGGLATSALAPGLSTRPDSWTSFDSGNVTLLFSSQSPAVTLYQDRDPSVRTTLVFEHIMEVAEGPRGPTGNHGPIGLLGRAFALPSGATSWTTSEVGSFSLPPGVWVNMTSSLTVHALASMGLAGVPIWQTPDGEVPGNDVGATLGQVQVTVSFHLEGVGTPGDQGLAKVGIEFSGWPWVDSAADLLALEWQLFSPGNGTQPVSCSSMSPPSNGTASSPCSSEMGLGVGAPVWANSTTAVEEVELGGLVSYVDWSNTGTVTTVGGAPTAVTLGAALFPISGSTLVRLLQTLPPGLGAVASFSEDPTIGLLPNLPPSLSHVLPTIAQIEGNGLAFAVAATATGLLVVVARGLGRRRDRSALERF